MGHPSAGIPVRRRALSVGLPGATNAAAPRPGLDLFVDDTLPLPRWLAIHDLDDLKVNLVSAVIAVLAVPFLREAVAWDGDRDLLAFGAALAVVIAALTFFLTVTKKGGPKE